VPIDDIPAEPDPLFTGNIAKIISDLVASRRPWRCCCHDPDRER